MALKKNSPYKKFFAKEIQNMIYNGVWNHYKERNSESVTDCNKPPEDGHPFHLFKIASIFIILFFGALSSILFLLYEYIKPQVHLHTT